MATKGRALRVKAAAVSGGPYTAIAGIRSGTISFGGQNVDISTLTSADIERLQGIRDCSVSLEGNYEADATGQGLIRAALREEDDLFIQFLPDGTTGFQLQMLPTKYDISGGTGDKMNVSIELEGSGAVTDI